MSEALATERVDLLVRGGLVLTMYPQRRVLTLDASETRRRVAAAARALLARAGLAGTPPDVERPEESP